MLHELLDISPCLEALLHLFNIFFRYGRIKLKVLRDMVDAQLKVLGKLFEMLHDKIIKSIVRS